MLKLSTYVTEPAVDEAANRAVITAIAEWLEIPRSRVRLVRGASGRTRVVEAIGLTALPRLGLRVDHDLGHGSSRLRTPSTMGVRAVSKMGAGLLENGLSSIEARTAFHRGSNANRRALAGTARRGAVRDQAPAL